MLPRLVQMYPLDGVFASVEEIIERRVGMIRTGWNTI
jgi:hypothetical protein